MDNKLKILLEQYESVKRYMKTHEAVIADLQPQILALLPEDQEIATEHGIVFIQKRPSYKYSAILEADRLTLKEREHMEIADGTADVTYNNILYYKHNKE